MLSNPQKVYCATSPCKSYSYSELKNTSNYPSDKSGSPADKTLRELLKQANLDAANQDTPSWNPFRELIKPTDYVVIKPNWVSHKNLSGAGKESLVTHTSVIEAIVRFVAKTHPRNIIVGDAPVQGCNFELLKHENQIDAMYEKLKSENIGISIKDFRQTILPDGNITSLSKPTNRNSNDYVLFDLGSDSQLESISEEKGNFRVTMYDPKALNKTHKLGKHQYLIAREVMEATVFINVPKLKTHKKAGITGALKNVVGINGLKDYLPHHRKGGSFNGGDCYEGKSYVKEITENMLDLTNRTSNRALKQLLSPGIKLGYLLGRTLGDDNNIEGSWYGNDTVWRMTLDLQRILHYGRADGTLSDIPQRKVITITDAIVAGEGDGPLAPTPNALSMMTMGINVCALEWVHALLMRLDPQRINLINEAFKTHKFPLANFSPEQIKIYVDGKLVTPDEVIANHSRPFLPPTNWQGHCELNMEDQL